ncbi:MAG: SPASM domain-containing protein, partial [Eubacteriales bacterium]
IEPVVTSGALSLTEADLPKIFEEYEALAEFLDENRKEKGLHFFHFTIDLSGGPCLNKRLRGCGAGVEYFAVNPDGNLYPCHQFAGEKDFIIGNVSDGVTNLQLQNKFKDAHIYTKDDCANCPVKYYCSGGCMANAYHANGDFNKPYHLECEMMKKRVELGIALSVLEEEND